MQPLITKLNTDKANPATNLAAPSKTSEAKLDLPKKKASESEWSTPRLNLQALLLDHQLMDSLNLNTLRVKEPTEPFSKSHPPIKLPLAHPSQDPASMELLHQLLEQETIQPPTNKECREAPTKPINLPPTRLQDSTKAETLEFIKLDHHLEQDMSHHIRSVSPLLQTSIKLDQQLVQEFTKPNLEVTQDQVQAVTNLTKEDHPTTTNQLLVTDLVVEVEPVNHHQLNTLAVQHTNSKRND